jgi:hypothetical protein
MSKPATGRQVAVMPRTAVTLRLARKLAPPMLGLAGISLLMICNTDGASWRRPRMPPKLSHWHVKFPAMGRWGGASRAWI